MMHRRGVFALMVGAVLGCAGGPSAPNAGRERAPGPVPPPGVQLSMRVAGYPVAGATVDELRAQMRRVGPVVDGVRYAGATRWSIRWTYAYDRRAMQCALRNVRVVVEARVELPRWEPGAAPDSAVALWWDGFSSHLREHEHGHVRVALEAGRQVVESFRSLSASACDVLGMQANTVGQGIIARARERDAAYDRDTRHGTLSSRDAAAIAPRITVALVPKAGDGR